MATSDDEFWWCTDETGELHTLSTSELRECLADGTIPAHALVWQPGWREWAPAARVPVFQVAIPSEQVDRGPPPRKGGSKTAPPPAPSAYYSRRRAARRAKLGPLELDLSELGSLASPRVPAGAEAFETDQDEPPTTPHFPLQERPTMRAPQGTLPEDAFPEREAFLAHVRERAARRARR